MKRLLILLLFCGCGETPESKYQNWKVSVFAPSGILHKEYTVRSVDKPQISLGWQYKTVLKVNRHPTLTESVLSDTDIKVPSQWLIEIE